MKDKRILSGQMAYVFEKCEDGIIMHDNLCFIANTEDIIELCEGLLTFAINHKQEIEEYNSKHDKEIYDQMCGHSIKAKESAKDSKKGYVYLLECGGKFKIGFSKDVERRMRQLDTRPFKLNLIEKSEFLSDAYDREQELHEWLEDSRIDGEWYDLTNEELEYLIEVIRGMKEGNYEQ